MKLSIIHVEVEVEVEEVEVEEGSNFSSFSKKKNLCTVDCILVRSMMSLATTTPDF